MPGENDPTAIADLTRHLAALRRDGAAPEWLADGLWRLVKLQAEQKNGPAAQAALGELDGLRRPEERGVEASYYLGAAFVASSEGEGPRAVWFAERAIALGKRHQLGDFLPHALLALSDFLLAIHRKDDSLRVRAEAADHFEKSGQLSHAVAAILSTDGEPGVDLPMMQRALALAERSDAPAAVGWALHSLGRWHLGREEYLPARHALERALSSFRAHGGPTDVAGCLADLSRLEGDAFHHDEAVRLAAEALEVLSPPIRSLWRAYALEARADALKRLHQHEAARADLLEAAACHEAEGDSRLAENCRVQARRERVATWLHRLPRWVFRPADLSTREAAAKQGFQPLGAWLVVVTLGAFLLSTHLCLSLMWEALERFGRAGLVTVLTLAFTPWALLMTVLVGAGRQRPRP